MIDTAYALAGALTGFIVGLTGVGGGSLMTPILLIFFGVSTHHGHCDGSLVCGDHQTSGRQGAPR